jgi:group I intron endonuclease
VFVYGILNLVNLKMYVGKANDPEARWYGHWVKANNGSEYAIHRAMRKYGHESFLRWVIQGYESEKEALDAEMKWIEYYDSTTSGWGYNMTLGGDGFIPTEELRKRQSEAAIIRWQNPNYGKEQVEAVKRKWQDPEFRAMMSELHRNKTFSEETRQKASISHKKYYESPEAREKNRQAQLICQNRPEVLEANRQRGLAYWEDPAFIEKQRLATERRWASEENREAHKLRQKAVLSQPEVRENMSKGQRKRFDTEEARVMRNTIVLLHLQGMSLKEIAESVDRCTKITRQYLVKAGFLFV